MSKIWWFPKENYEKIHNELSNWPDWKKAAYNRMFALSSHAQRFKLSNEADNQNGEKGDS